MKATELLPVTSIGGKTISLYNLMKEHHMAYRKRNDSDTWHWCRNCSNWPTSDYDERTDRPSYDLCNECKGKEKAGTCKS